MSTVVGKKTTTYNIGSVLSITNILSEPCISLTRAYVLLLYPKRDLR